MICKQSAMVAILFFSFHFSFDKSTLRFIFGTDVNVLFLVLYNFSSLSY